LTASSARFLIPRVGAGLDNGVGTGLRCVGGERLGASFSFSFFSPAVQTRRDIF
jgi:hypothetical protein